MKYVVDFETYYDKETSVSVQGLPNYTAAADAYLVSVVCDDFEFCGSPAELVRELGTDWMKAPDAEFWAANANFDQSFWEKHFGPTAKPWQCVLDRAAFAQLPRSLSDVCRVVMGRELDKQVRDDMRGVRFEELPAEQQERVRDYCFEDARATRELLGRLDEMSPTEQALAEQTRRLNRTGVHVDLERAEADRDRLHRLKWEAGQRLPWTEEELPSLSYQAFADHCRRRGVEPPLSLDKREPACAEWVKANPELGRWVEDMRLLRGANTKIKKIQKLLDIEHGGVMPLELLYCGARHTRRWSSRGFNVQNLDREPAFSEELARMEGVDEEDVPELGVFLRSYLLPPPGHVFGILDYSQIEPRALSWIVDNRDMLEAIRSGYGIYEAHAKATMGWEGRPGTLKKTDPARYQFAKIRVLALGYGMGPALFQRTAAAAGITLSPEEAAAQVKDFRDTNPGIVSYWRDRDELVRACGMKKTGDRVIEIEMPTGDLLRHFGVRMWARGNERGFESITIQGEYSHQSRQNRLWGGTLTENVTQRMARDILGDALLRLERAGFKVVFHAHDEVVLALPAATAKADFAEAKRLMQIAPDWCHDLPLQVEGDVVDRYTKLG